MFVIFDARGVILTHTVPLGQTVNAAYYMKVSLLINIQTNNYYFTGCTIDDFKFIPGAFKFMCFLFSDIEKRLSAGDAEEEIQVPAVHDLSPRQRFVPPGIIDTDSHPAA